MNVEWDYVRSNMDMWEVLGSGGFGTVYKTSSLNLPGEASELAVKIYKRQDGNINAGQFESLIDVRERLKREEPKWCEKLDSMFTWPLALVTDEGHAKGVVMNLIPDKYFGTVTSRMAKGTPIERKLGHVMDDGEISGWGPLPTTTKLEILREIAYALAFLHNLGNKTRGNVDHGDDIIYGDISANNILCSVDGKTEIMFVDCDSVRKSGTQAPAGRQAHTDGWEPPEVQEAQRKVKCLDKSEPDYQFRIQEYQYACSRQTKNTDVYKFGLVFLRVIDSGRYASTRTNPKDAKRKVSASLGRLLDASLSTDPDDRPTMKEWVAAFGGAAEEFQAPRQQSNRKSTVKCIDRTGDFVQLPSGIWIRDPGSQ
ncbi:hypothetical protein [Varibaculum massiliense]|uniref:hypothetical protein n=1 Tax=Varibaculum massiliense TaxID=1852372 RepID=UPI00288A46E6|nr:hypothetical protein [Varibaculum massiliense]